jgi:hypothetical protein
MGNCTQESKFVILQHRYLFLRLTSRFIDDYLKGNQRPTKEFEIDFAIAEYPKEVLQFIRSKNFDVCEKGEGSRLPFQRTEMYFQFCRSLVSQLIG